MLHGGTELLDGADDHGEGGPPQLPDFALVDVNSTSPTYDQAVSPRDSLEQVSVWLFGWAT